jgi:membrane-associated protease RseP (regulator of RpoE activity)
MTEQEIISQLKALKGIKPRKEWASSLRSQIILGAQERITKIPAQPVNIFSILFSLLAPRKMAYAFAALLFLVVGFFGFTHYAPTDDQAAIKNSVAALSSGLNDLAKQGKTDSVINEIKTSASELAKNLKENPTDSVVMKQIAVSLKTLGDVTGVDLSGNSDVQNLYQAVVEAQIIDLEKSILTELQNESLIEIREFYKQGRYAEALEKILLIGK